MRIRSPSLEAFLDGWLTGVIERTPSVRGRRHQTPPALLRWFPQRQFVCAAGGNSATHALAQLAAKHPMRLTYLSHFDADAARYQPPPPATPGTKRAGRPRQKGRKLPSPADLVAQTERRQRLNVAWHGDGRRDVEVVTGAGRRYQSGAGLVAVRWEWV